MDCRREEVFITKEAFCQVVDSLLKDAPIHVRQFFKDFASEPETTARDMQEIVNRMLDSLCKGKTAQCVH